MNYSLKGKILIMFGESTNEFTLNYISHDMMTIPNLCYIQSNKSENSIHCGNTDIWYILVEDYADLKLIDDSDNEVVYATICPNESKINKCKGILLKRYDAVLSKEIKKLKNKQNKFKEILKEVKNETGECV